MNRSKYVGLFLVILIFGVLFIPKIIDRISNNAVVQDGRSASAEPLQYIVLNGEAKPPSTLGFTDAKILKP